MTGACLDVDHFEQNTVPSLDFDQFEMNFMDFHFLQNVSGMVATRDGSVPRDIRFFIENMKFLF